MRKVIITILSVIAVATAISPNGISVGAKDVFSSDGLKANNLGIPVEVEIVDAPATAPVEEIIDAPAFMPAKVQEQITSNSPMDFVSTTAVTTTVAPATTTSTEKLETAPETAPEVLTETTSTSTSVTTTTTTTSVVTTTDVPATTTSTETLIVETSKTEDEVTVTVSVTGKESWIENTLKKIISFFIT